MSAGVHARRSLSQVLVREQGAPRLSSPGLETAAPAGQICAEGALPTALGGHETAMSADFEAAGMPPRPGAKPCAMLRSLPKCLLAAEAKSPVLKRDVSGIACEWPVEVFIFGNEDPVESRETIARSTRS